MKVFGFALVALLACSCGGTPPQTYCNDFVSAAGAMAERCGLDAEQTKNDIVNQLGGSCLYVAGIRDEDELEHKCIPWLANVSCADVLLDFQLDPSCVGQLEAK